MAYLFVKIIHLLVRSTKCRKNHNVSLSNRFKVLRSIAFLFDKVNVHASQLVVHFGIVDEFICDMDLLALEVIDGLVGECNRTFYAPAKAKIL